MEAFHFAQEVKQLEAIKGGYFYFSLSAQFINKFERKRHTRLVCEIEEKVRFSCGLSHLGDGNYFIIISKSNLKKTGKTLGEVVNFTIQEDPNPLGVEVPEFLEVLLKQDSKAKGIWEAMTDGKKRSLIYTSGRIKNFDLAVNRSLAFLEDENRKMMVKKK